VGNALHASSSVESVLAEEGSLWWEGFVRQTDGEAGFEGGVNE